MRSRMPAAEQERGTRRSQPSTLPFDGPRSSNFVSSLFWASPKPLASRQ